MEIYLYDISKVRKDMVMDRTIIKQCMTLMEESIKSSTRFYFLDSEFY